MSSDAAPYAAEFLRETDRDRYFSTLVLPEAARDAATAIHAFNADLATIRERAREPAAGEIRLQWWLDALEGSGHGDVRQNPLAAALLDAIERYSLPVAGFVRLAGARRFDLYDDPMPDMPTFEGYAGETNSILYQLVAMVLNDGRPVETGDAAGHLGVAHALVGHLRAFGFNASRGAIFLPWSVLAANGVQQDEVRGGQISEGLAEALGQLAEIAGEHLGAAEAAIAALPAPLRPAFAPIAVVRAQLRRLRFDAPFQKPEDLADWRKIALLGWWRLGHG